MALIWMCYDLGIDGDYDGLYLWLDEMKAVECGDGACSLKLDVGDREPPEAVLAALKRRKIKLRPKDRLYLIWKRDNGLMTGKFIAGTRRRAPWSGYATGPSEEETEDAAG